MSENPVVEKKKRRLSPLAIIAICLVLAIALAAGGYYYSYTRADGFADEGDFISARQWLVLPSLTEKHDARLPAYLDAQDILAGGDYAAAADAFAALGAYKDSAERVTEAKYLQAGKCMDGEDYTKAVELYTELGDFRKSAEKLVDARYGLGMQILEQGDPAAAYDIFAQLKEAGYEKAGEALAEATYQWVLILIEQDELAQAYEMLADIPEHPKAAQTLEELTELIYVAAQEAYRQEQSVDAVKYFLLITPYKDSEAYFALIQINNGVGYTAMKLSPRGLMDYDELFASMWENFELENTKELMLTDSWIGARFLRGNWKTDNGGYYFKMDEEHTAYTNLPRDKSDEVLYYSITDGMYYVRLENDVNKARYQFTVIDADTMEVYCYYNGETYILYRQ